MSMMRSLPFISLALLLAAPLAAQPPQLDDDWFFEKGRLRVLILTGRNNHDWRASTPHLRRILDATGLFDVRVSEEPAGLTPETLRPYHVLVVDYCGPRWGGPAEDAVAAFVREGKGLVAVHAASYPFGVMPVLTSRMGRSPVHEAPWGEWEKMLGARWQPGDPDKNVRPTGHSRRHIYDVTWSDTAHPIATGLPATFTTSDELYSGFHVAAPIHVLARAFDDPAQQGTGKHEPLIWTNAYHQGRVFHTALGHDVPAMMSQGFIDSFARGVEWAATGRVSIPPNLALEPKDKNAVRVLVVTGGHDHEASFYSVFEGQRDLRVNVDPHPVAFRNDIRKRYDVVVLYDSIQELPENQKQHFKNFAEAGKGVVVLHHALVDFQTWPWFKELAGGLYILGDKGSTYLHDVDMKVTPVAGHPITRGLPPMWLRDETYKGVWHHSEIRPLVTTDHPTSDPVVAWISPYPHSRVVTIQPGHGREAHENPWFRRLVRNAILWSAARLE